MIKSPNRANVFSILLDGKNPHGYPFVYLKPDTNKLYRVRAGILPQGTQYGYLSKIIGTVDIITLPLLASILLKK